MLKVLSRKNLVLEFFLASYVITSEVLYTKNISYIIACTFGSLYCIVG